MRRDGRNRIQQRHITFQQPQDDGLLRHLQSIRNVQLHKSILLRFPVQAQLSESKLEFFIQYPMPSPISTRIVYMCLIPDSAIRLWQMPITISIDIATSHSSWRNLIQIP